MFTERHLTWLEETMRAVCVDFQTELVEFNGEAEHVHLLVNLPPKVALSKLVNSLKGVSWRRMRQVFPDFARHYYPTNKLASPPDAPRPCGGPASVGATAGPDRWGSTALSSVPAGDCAHTVARP
nr:IS200/IS605 family transposase [Micromonospora globispora]